MSWIDHLKQELTVIKSAPIAAVVCAGVGFGIGTWYYLGRIDYLKDQVGGRDGQIARYRIALGIDKASSGNLIELKNDELRPKALSTAARLRNICLLNGKRVNAAEMDWSLHKRSRQYKELESMRILRDCRWDSH